MMTIKQLREMRGLTQKELADAIGVRPQNMNNYETGIRSPGYKTLPELAEKLHASAAYLIGQPELLPVYDPIAQATTLCSIISSDTLTHSDGSPYGVYYLVEHSGVEGVLSGVDRVLAVILADGVQFVPDNDWLHDQQPLTVDAIADTRWMDNAARSVVMLDGLPHLTLG